MYSKMRMPGWDRRVKVHVSASDFIDQSAASHFFLSILKATQSIGWCLTLHGFFLSQIDIKKKKKKEGGKEKRVSPKSGERLTGM